MKFDRNPKINSQDIEHKQNSVKEKSSICSEDIEENTFSHQARAITLLFINEFNLFAIQNHSSLISKSMQSLKNIGKKYSS